MTSPAQKEGAAGFARWPAALAVLILAGFGTSRVRAGSIEEHPPSPIPPRVSRPLPKIELPAKAQPKPEASGPQTGDQPGKQEEKPQRRWKRLTPDQLISSKSLLYLSSSNIKQMKRALQSSALKGLLDEDDVQAPLHNTLQRLKDAWVEGNGARSAFEKHRRAYEVNLLEKLLPFVDGHVALAVELQKAAARPGGVAAAAPAVPQFSFLAVLSMPMGEKGRQRQQAIGDLLDRMSASLLLDPRYKDDLKEIGPYKVQKVISKDLDLHESWAFVENLFLYGQGEGIVERAVRTYHQKRGAGALAQHPGYNEAFAKVGEDAHFYLQVDASALIKRFVNQAPVLGQMLGVRLDELDKKRPQLAIGMSIQEGDNAPIKEKLLWRVPPANAPEAQSPCKTISAFVAASNTLFYHAQQQRLAALLKSKIEAGRRQAQGKQRNLAQNFMNELMRGLGVDNEDEVWRLLAPFKGELATILNYVPTEKRLEDIFQPVFAVEFRQEERANVNNVLERLRRATKLDYKKISYQTVEIHYQQGAQENDPLHTVHPFVPTILGLGPLLGGKAKPPKGDEQAGIPFFVAYAIVEVDSGLPGEKPRHFVLFSDHIKALKKAVQQENAHRHSLAERPEYKLMVSGFNQGRHAISFLDLPALALALYRNLLPQMVQKKWMKGTFFQRLPNEQAFIPHLSPMAWAATVLNEGELFEFVSPTGNLPLMGLVTAFAWPEIVDTQRQRVSSGVDEKFKQISLALHLYAADFDRFPPKLSDLHPQYIRDFRFFASPFKPKAVLKREDIDNPEKTNMVYVPGTNLQDLSRTILLWEVRPTRLVQLKNRSRIVHHVLYLNGKINPPLPTVRLQRILQGKIVTGNILLPGNAGAPDSRAPAGQSAVPSRSTRTHWLPGGRTGTLETPAISYPTAPSGKEAAPARTEGSGQR